MLEPCIDRPQLVDTSSAADGSHDPPNDVAARPERWPAAVPTMHHRIGRFDPPSGVALEDGGETGMLWPRISSSAVAWAETEAQDLKFVARSQRVGITKRQRVKRTKALREWRAVEQLRQLQCHKVQPIRRRVERRRVEHARRAQERSPTNPIHLATLCACTVNGPEADCDAIYGRVQKVCSVRDIFPHVCA